LKVVLFCGGLGMRMRDGVTTAPKPMAMVGERPLLWHVMRYYAHFGHTDFVLCLGYGASHVKDFFLHYDETTSNDFVLENGARDVSLFRTDISDWRITFVDTGLNSPIGERLRRVRRFVADEPMFLANYADVLTDAPLPDTIARFEASSAVASLLAVPPQSSHHVVEIGDDGLISQLIPMRDLRQWENGGYFVLRPEIFNYLNEGEDLVEDAIMRRLVPERRVLAYPYKGYWSPADTVKERAQLEEMYHRGYCPWMIWDADRSAAVPPAGIPLDGSPSDVSAGNAPGASAPITA
jgi:glucose-1-phosphate cytidylyltransferase